MDSRQSLRSSSLRSSSTINSESTVNLEPQRPVRPSVRSATNRDRDDRTAAAWHLRDAACSSR